MPIVTVWKHLTVTHCVILLPVYLMQFNVLGLQYEKVFDSLCKTINKFKKKRKKYSLCVIFKGKI